MAVNLCFCVRLSPNKKSIFGLKMGYQMLFLVLFIGLVAASSASATDGTCSSVRSAFDKKGILAMIDLQDRPGSDLQGMCVTKGCCGDNARVRLTQHARSQLEGALRSELKKLADILANRAKKFDEFFRKLLMLSREEFHMMFKRTYGMIYEQHSYVFEQLFEKLERYYTRGDADFDVMMDGFFSILYQKMFTVLNSQYSFDEIYLKCVSEHMRTIQPFEDVPSKLSVQLRRAFVATRTFHKALRHGSEVVKSMMQIDLSPECVTAWTQLRFCGSCAGEQQPPCSRYCHNVLRGCLPAHADLAEQWDAYVDAVEKVADRLLGPFNIAMVVEPIDIKISEAIMSFQERNQDISQKIFSDCGKPVLGGGASTGPFFSQERARRFARSAPDFVFEPYGKDRDDDFEIEASFESIPEDQHQRHPRRVSDEGKRDFITMMNSHIANSNRETQKHERERRDAEPDAAAAGAEIDFKSYEFDGKRGAKGKKTAPTKLEDTQGRESGPLLERLVRETRARVRASRRYWVHLVPALCTSASSTATPCFNGTHVSSYSTVAAGDGSAALASNPEVRGATVVSGARIARAQLDSLKFLTAKLKDAYNGVEVQWKDSVEDLQEEAAASNDLVDIAGSGSGSGDRTDDTDHLPDDDEDRTGDFDYPEGSGDRRPGTGAPEEYTPQPAPVPREPYVPSVVTGPATNNVQTRVLLEPDDSSTSGAAAQPEPPVEPEQPAQGQPVAAGAAERPTLTNALLSYALPVVCAWFGTIVTDLF